MLFKVTVSIWVGKGCPTVNKLTRNSQKNHLILLCVVPSAPGRRSRGRRRLQLTVSIVQSPRTVSALNDGPRKTAAMTVQESW